MRLIAVDREELRRLLFDDSAFSELVLTAFIRRREALQAGLASASRSSARATTPRPVAWSSSRSACGSRSRASILRTGRGVGEGLPLVRLPGGVELTAPSNGELSRALGIGLELPASRRSTCS